MSLSLVLSALKIAGRNTQSIEAWVQQEDLRALNVARFRRYADGDHDNTLTTEQKHLLNIRSGSGEDSARFNDNLCSIILDTMQDRINLTGIKSDNEQADEWIAKLLERERIDGLQVDVHGATLRDGNHFLMVHPDREGTALTNPNYGRARFSPEPAYDGAYGTLVMYETAASKTPMLAIKVWKITNAQIADTTRVNVYYPDRIERWIGETATGLREYTDDGQPARIPWVMADGTPIGVPFVHFRNRPNGSDSFGLSELDNVIPLQNATNVVLTSIVASSLLSGFPIRLMIGGEVPAAVVPGMVLNFFLPKDSNGNPIVTGQTAIDWLASIRKDQFDPADLSQLLGVAAWLKTEMYAVTNTPTDDVAADASGEARKQSEVKLIGKVKRFEVKNGNAWEDAVRLAQRIETVYAPQQETPAFETLTAQWDDPEVRNDAQFVDTMLKQYREGVIDQRTYLESVQGIFGWDDAKVDAIVAETEKAKNQQAQQEINTTTAIEQARADAAAAMNGANGNGAAKTAA